MTERERACRFCGKAIRPERPKNRNRVYCDASCRYAYWDRQRAKAPVRRVACVYCGDPIRPSADGNPNPRLYCSDTCRGLAFRGSRVHGEQDISAAEIERRMAVVHKVRAKVKSGETLMDTRRLVERTIVDDGSELVSVWDGREGLSSYIGPSSLKASATFAPRGANPKDFGLI